MPCPTADSRSASTCSPAPPAALPSPRPRSTRADRSTPTPWSPARSSSSISTARPARRRRSTSWCGNSTTRGFMPCRSGSSVAVAAARPRRAVLGSLTAAAAANSVPALAPLAPPLARALRIPRTLGGDGVALTFDDGPHPEGTAAVLEGLREADATAAFFLVGEQVRSNPSLAAEIVAAGHSVELHGDRHRNQLRLTPAQMFEDMRRGAAAIEDACGRAPRFYRPPYGIFPAAGLWTGNRPRWRPLLWAR